MSGLLQMIDDFVDRMMDPSYGALVNEEYSLRVGELLSDEETALALSRQAERLRFAEELSLNTWIWLLGGASRQQLNPGLLLDLCRSFQAPSFQAMVIEYALQGTSRIDPETTLPMLQVPQIEAIESRWLRDLVRDAVAPIHSQEELPAADNTERDDDLVLRIQHSQNLLIALLTVNRQDCLTAAASLLHHQWEGQTEVLTYFLSCLDVMDEEPRNYWGSLTPRS